MNADQKYAYTLGELAGSTRFSPRARANALQSTAYWKQPQPVAQNARAALPTRADVVIVGSGFTGLSAALTLARHGRSVVVLEAGELGEGASTRNGGQVGSGNQKFRVRTLIDRFGETKARALLREGVAMLDFVEQLVNEEKIDCHFTRCGRFRGAVRPEHYEAMARDLDDLKRYAGVESFAVPKAEQYREIATDYFHGGSVLPNDGSVHPGKLHGGLVARVAEAGGQLISHAHVDLLEKQGDGFKVKTGRGDVQAGAVLVATNGYTDHIDPYVKKRVVRVHSSVITTQALDEQRINALMPSGRVYGNSARVFFYFRAAPDAPRLIWGGRKGRLHHRGSPAAFGHLAKEVLAVFPSLESVGVSHGWTGNIGYTFDEFPHLGTTPDGVHYAMGYCGTGVSRSLYFGRKMALKIVGSKHGQTAFDAFEFPSHPFHYLANSVVPLVESWYRFKDRLN